MNQATPPPGPGRPAADVLDRQLIQALCVDGRAKFSAIATVLGATQQTIARRYRRLQALGSVRVLGRLDVRPFGDLEWVLRLRCTPGSSMPVAQALGRHRDARWVCLASGGAEIIVMIRTCRCEDGEEPLTRVPDGDPVTGLSAHAVMHTFTDTPAGWQGVLSALTGEQAAQLRPALAVSRPAAGRGVAPRLAEGDRVLAGQLARDGRTSNRALAVATGWHESTVRHRIACLRAAAILSLDVAVDERFLGYASTALLWISVAPGQLPAAGSALARRRGVVFAAATTGPANLLAMIVCRDHEALAESLATGAGALPGLRHLEIVPVTQTIKRAGEAR